MVENNPRFEKSRKVDIQLLFERFNYLIESGQGIDILEQLQGLVLAGHRWQGEKVTIKSRDYSDIYRGNFDEGDITTVEWDRVEYTEVIFLDIILFIPSSFNKARLKYILCEEEQEDSGTRLNLLPFCMKQGEIVVPGAEAWVKGIEITNLIGNLFKGEERNIINLPIDNSYVQNCQPREVSEERKLIRINKDAVTYGKHWRKRIDMAHNDLKTLIK